VNRGKNLLYLLQMLENGPFYLALTEKTSLISPEPSPILQDNEKNFPYKNNQRMLAMKNDSFLSDSQKSAPTSTSKKSFIAHQLVKVEALRYSGCRLLFNTRRIIVWL
jgi:hypothetical protein